MVAKITIPLSAITTPPPCPKGLGSAGQAFWKAAVEARKFEPADLSILEACCRMFDRAAQATARIESEGPFVVNRFGETVPNRALEVERASLAQAERLRRALNLDCSPKSVLKPLPKNLRDGYR